MHVRLFEQGDEEHIAQIHNSAFKNWIESLGNKYYYKLITSEEVLSWLDDANPENESLWVAEESGNPVGYAHCKLQIERNDRKIPILYFVQTHWDMGQSKIAVLPNYQRKGVGTLLIKSVIEYYR